MKIEILDSPTLLVVDASVFAKWLLPEPDREIALRLRYLYQRGEVSLEAPSLVVSEVGNLLWKRVRRGEMSQQAAVRSFDQFLVDAPSVVESTELVLSAFRLALRNQHPIYDCLYLALALERHCDLITADEKLCRSLQPAYPFIRFLRDFQS